MPGPLGKLTAVLGLDAREFHTGIAGANKTIFGFGVNAKNVGTAVGTTVGAMGIGALRMGDEFDQATDAIRLGTGATGEALGALEQSFKNVAGTVKEDIGLTASVLADLNTRTGLSGEALEGLTKNVIEFSRVTGTDATSNTASITRLFGDWSVATEDQAEVMDKLLRASQATGLGVDDLMQTVVQFGAPLRLLGFGMEESIALLGKWEKEGVNTETMLTGLKFSVKTLANEGVPAAEMADTLRAKIEAIGTSTDPVSDAIKLFGLRAGPDLAAAILEGRFSVDDLIETIENGSETVATAADATRDFGDGFAELKNKVKLAVGPIMKDFAGLTEELGNAVYLIPALTGALGRGLGSLWTKLGGSALIKGAAAAAGAAAGFAYDLGVKGAAVIGGALSAAWVALGSPGSSVVLAAKAAGISVGGTFVAGMVFALPLLVTALVPAIRNAIEDALDLAGESGWLHGTIFDSLGDIISPDSAASLVARSGTVGLDAGDYLATRFEEGVTLGPPIPPELLWDRILPGFKIGATRLGGEAGLAGGEAVADGVWTGARERLMALGRTILGALPEILRASAQEVGFASGAAMVDNVGAGIRAESMELGSALSELRDILKNGLTPKQEAAQALGSQFITDFRDGLSSKKQGAVETARQVGIEALQALGDLAAAGGKLHPKRIGQIIDGLYASGMSENAIIGALAAEGVGRDALMALASVRGWNPAGVDDALAWIAGVESKEGAAGDAGALLNERARTAAGRTGGWGTAGGNVAGAWISGVTRRLTSANTADIMHAAISKFGRPMRGQSPPKVGPLRDIDRQGENVAHAWLDPFLGTLRGGARQVGQALSGYGMGVSGPALASPGAGNRGSITINVGNVYGGQAGLRELAEKIEHAVRHATRR